MLLEKTVNFGIIIKANHLTYMLAEHKIKTVKEGSYQYVFF